MSEQINGVLVKNGRVAASGGHYSKEELEKSLNQFNDGTGYILYGDEARAFSWNLDYERMSATDRWMIDVAISELPTVQERMKYSVNKLVGVAQTRIKKAGFTTVCSRCGGTGHYSFNLLDGTICYGCRGSKLAMVKLTKENKKAIEAHFAQVNA